MKCSQIRLASCLLCLCLSQPAAASDVVPFSIKRLKPVGSGYVELLGPGKIRTGNEVVDFEESKYVKKANIGTMTSEDGTDRGCTLAYSSEGYTENILVRNQSCNEILSIFRVTN